MKVLTNMDISIMRDVLTKVGFVCEVKNGGDNAVNVSLDWFGHYAHAWKAGVEAACFFIRNNVRDISIEYLSGDDEELDWDGDVIGFRCWATLRVSGI